MGSGTGGRAPRRGSAGTWDRGVVALAVGAVLLRLLLFVGRGDYVAFDEGWYLLLGRSLMTGDGYTLNGLPHVALSPLFPLLAGAAGALIGDAVWGGRVVAAVASGLLVLPCWSVFRRLAGRRTAMLACGFVAVLPSLAPFVVPFWIGWDLWVGAEPVLHVFLYSAIALYLRAQDEDRPSDWLLAGAAFGLAYLARPEAVIPFGLLGLVAVGRWLRGTGPRRGRSLAAPVLLAVSFVVVAAPYWMYLHDATGRWQLTGRSVEIGPRPMSVDAGDSPAETIERMLWEDRESDYLRNLYSLDASGSRLLSPYWGVRPPAPGNGEPRSPDRAGAPRAGSGATTSPSASPPDTDTGAGPVVGSGSGRRPLAARYAGALRTVVPVYLWPLVLLGVAVPRRRFRRELLVAGPIVVTSVMIAGLVAADPRTQLFVAPMAAFYAARGTGLVGLLADRLLRGGKLRRGFVRAALAAALLATLLGADTRRLYMSLTVGSPHHVLGSGKRLVGEFLRRTVPEEERVMSWHPAIAVYAERRWCVLPYAEAPAIVRYARSAGCPTLVVSAFHPAPWPIVDLGYEYVILELPPDDGGGLPTTLSGLADRGRYAVGRLAPSRP